MRLLIISHTEHYLRGGEIVGSGATVREISHLATLFDEVRHVAMLHPGEAPASALPYTASNVTLVALNPSGGATLAAKLGILLAYPRYAAALAREIRRADAVHVRAPANIALLALLLLPFFVQPTRRWIKYAGNWKPDAPDARSYRLQRWLIRRGWHRGQVTVNGQWPDEPPFIQTFINPCLTDEEADEGRRFSGVRALTQPVRLIFVGRVERAKGVERALRVIAALKQEGTAAHLDLIGDGSERPALEALADALGLRGQVTFHGWMPRTALPQYYAQAHLLLFPSNSEGWPKVISEAMAYGVVPLVGSVSAIPQTLRALQVGMAIPPLDVDGFAAGVRAYLDDPARWMDESRRAVEAAGRFRYSIFLDDVRRVLGLSG